jgi:hypothetical protein
VGHNFSRAKDQAAQGRASPGARRVAGRGSPVSRSGRGTHGGHCDCADRYGDATGGELPPSLGVYRLVEWTVRNATGDARQDGRGTADASLESACAGAPRAALGGSEEAVRRLGWATATASGHMEPSTVKKQHQRALRLSGVRPFVLYALRHTFLTRLGAAGCDAWTLARADRGAFFDCDVRSIRPSE